MTTVYEAPSTTPTGRTGIWSVMSLEPDEPRRARAATAPEEEVLLLFAPRGAPPDPPAPPPPVRSPPPLPGWRGGGVEELEEVEYEDEEVDNVAVDATAAIAAVEEVNAWLWILQQKGCHASSPSK